MSIDRHGEQQWEQLRVMVAQVPQFRNLTPRELDILCLIGKGLTNLEIASELFISPHTVKNHVTNIYRKLGIDDRTQLAILVQKYIR